MGETVHPKIFVIHAHEDKERFVRSFAADLRRRGIDAWVDEWELQPGDSLVDRIFEEGLKEAKTVVVVLSARSIDKRWVREELNASLIQRIQGNCRIIPIVLDDCEVPECLHSTLWVKVGDPANFGVALERVVMSVLGLSDKPPVGHPTELAKREVVPIAGMSKLDSQVLKLVCENALNCGAYTDAPARIFAECEAIGISKDTIYESIGVLEHYGYVTYSANLSGAIETVTVTFEGFNVYIRSVQQDYDGFVRQVALAVVNQDMGLSSTIAEAINCSPLLVEHALEGLAQKGYLEVQKFVGPGSRVWHVNPILRRWLDGGA